MADDPDSGRETNPATAPVIPDGIDMHYLIRYDPLLKSQMECIDFRDMLLDRASLEHAWEDQDIRSLVNYCPSQSSDVQAVRGWIKMLLESRMIEDSTGTIATRAESLNWKGRDLLKSDFDDM